MNNTFLSMMISTSLAFTACSGNEKSDNTKSQSPGHTRVETIVAEWQQPEQTLNYSGIVIPSMKTPLSFQLPGMVIKIYVDEGDEVRKGQKLAELDSKNAQSSYQMAAAMQAQAQDAYDRLSQVHEQGSLPEIKWEEVKSKLEQAIAAAQIATQNLKNSIITAPIDGVIGSKNTEVGANVVPGIAAFDLLNLKELYVRISVPENEISKIRKGQKARVTIPAVSSEEMTATVEKIGVVANLISKTYEVRLLLKNPGGTIKPGMACDINLDVTIAEKSITLPFSAVMQDENEQKYVYVVENEKALKRSISVGEFENNEIKIVSGLVPGDMVVVSGQHKLHDRSVDVLFN